MLFAGVAMVPKPPRITGDLIFLMGSGRMSGSLSGDAIVGMGGAERK